MRQQWDELGDSHGDIKGEKAEGMVERPVIRRKMMRLEDLGMFLLRYQLDVRCMTKVLSYVTTNRLLPGKRGTGSYTDAQVSVFDAIKVALASNRPVALGTLKEVAKASSGKGVSTGESIGKGWPAVTLTPSSK